MNNKLKRNGFSLTEVLMAVGILTVGLVFIAGVFPVGIRFTTIAAERTKAAVAADEAFAKIQLYGINFDPSLWPQDANNCVDFYGVADVNDGVDIPSDEFAYPSAGTGQTYYWSALCRQVDPVARLVQITVFVCRKIGANAEYWERKPDDSLEIFDDYDNYPIPVWVDVGPGDKDDELQIQDVIPNDGIDEATFVNDGCTIVDNATGRLYRVLERIPHDRPEGDIIKLDRNWRQNPVVQEKVWVIPSPANGGRYPCVAVYQRVIKF